MLKIFHRKDIQRKFLHTDEGAQIVTMFYIFASDNTNNRFLVGIVAGRKANSTQRWLTLEEPDNDTFFIDSIPIIAFCSTENTSGDNQTAMWHIGTAHLVRTAHVGWTWIPDLTMMPPRPLTFTRSYRLEYALEPSYICVRFNPEGVPILVAATPPIIGQHIVCPAQLMNVAEVTSKASHNLAASMVRFSRRDFNNNLAGQVGVSQQELVTQAEGSHYNVFPEAEHEYKSTEEGASLSSTHMDQATPGAASSYNYISVAEAIASFRRLSLEEGQDRNKHDTLKESETDHDRPQVGHLDPPEDEGGH